MSGTDDGLLYPQVRAWVQEQSWAILPGKLSVMLDVLRMRADGGRFTPEEIAQQIGAQGSRMSGAAGGNVAVLPLLGVVAQRAGLMMESSGGTSTDRFGAQFDELVADPSIKGIVLDVDSPGGSVFGVPELAAKIHAARGHKPIIAVANSVTASAAYWIASAADELVVTPSGEVGSIGVLAVHEDMSRALDAAGVTVSLVSAGNYKAEGTPTEPLGDEARAAIQQRVDEYYGLFVGAVARHRGVEPAQVRDGYGQGRMLGATAAKRAGMVDRIDTLADTIQRLAGGRWRRPQRGSTAVTTDVPYVIEGGYPAASSSENANDAVPYPADDGGAGEEPVGVGAETRRRRARARRRLA